MFISVHSSRSLSPCSLGLVALVQWQASLPQWESVAEKACLPHDGKQRDRGRGGVLDPLLGFVPNELIPPTNPYLLRVPPPNSA